VGSGIQAWGRFEADDPDKRFRVLTGSQFREPVLNPENATYDQLVKLTELQDTLAGEGVLDPASMTFAREHVFDNWTRATRVVSGTGLSGASHWQPLIDHGD
jgi:hypothetical protein